MPKDPDILVDLTTARTAFEAEMIAESLRAQGIPAEAFTIAGSTLQWDIAATQPMRVQVRRCDLERAGEVLRAIRADSVDLDWSEVNTGDTSPVTEGERTAAQPRQAKSRRRDWGFALVIFVVGFITVGPLVAGSVGLWSTWVAPFPAGPWSAAGPFLFMALGAGLTVLVVMWARGRWRG